MMLARFAFMMRAYSARVGPLETMSMMPMVSFCMFALGIGLRASNRSFRTFGVVHLRLQPRYGNRTAPTNAPFSLSRLGSGPRRMKFGRAEGVYGRNDIRSGDHRRSRFSPWRFDGLIGFRFCRTTGNCHRSPARRRHPKSAPLAALRRLGLKPAGGSAHAKWEFVIQGCTVVRHRAPHSL